MYIVTEIHSLYLSFFHLSLNHNCHVYDLQKYLSVHCHFPQQNLDQLATYTFVLKHTHISLPSSPPRELNGQMCGAEDLNQSSKLKNRNCVGVAQLYCAVLYCTVSLL